MQIHMMPTLLRDLKESNDARFVRRVIDQIVDGEGNFRKGADDHRYHGIENAWIRYVSAGKSAYRLIYILNGSDVYLYRAGSHSVEDNLKPPSQLKGFPIRELALKEHDILASAPTAHAGNFLKTSLPTMISKAFNGLTHVGHKEIYLVSPYISFGLLSSQSAFGRFLDRAIEENTIVALVTRPSENPDLDAYSSLEARGIFVHFHSRLHAKLYVFEINEATVNQYNRNTISSTAILGSANLTSHGLGLYDEPTHEELCYQVPEVQFWEAKQHAEWLVQQSTDLGSFKMRFRRKF